MLDEGKDGANRSGTEIPFQWFHHRITPASGWDRAFILVIEQVKVKRDSCLGHQAHSLSLAQSRGRKESNDHAM